MSTEVQFSECVNKKKLIKNLKIKSVLIVMTHRNAVIHTMTHRKKNTTAYNTYMKLYMRKIYEWKKIQLIFLNILLD